MISRFLRRLIHEELESIEKGLASHLADLIVKNNEQIEADLVNLGLLERGEAGELHVKPRVS